MTEGNFLVVRRSGAIWAIPEDGVRAVHRTAHAATVDTVAATATVDEVVAIATLSAARLFGRAVRGYVGTGAVGAGLLDGACVTIVDPEHLPAPLRSDVEPTPIGRPRAPGGRPGATRKGDRHG